MRASDLPSRRFFVENRDCSGTGNAHTAGVRLFTHAVFVLALLSSPSRQARSNGFDTARMLSAHNAVRKKAGVTPLAWSDELASAAQQWANHLIESGKFYHQPHNPHGENIYENMGAAATPEQVLNAWASEARYYDYTTNSCSKACGHYTQLVWKDSKQVGCAMAEKGSRQVWVCEYNPPGNYLGKRPY